MEKLLTNDSPFAVKEAYIKLRTNLMFSLSTDGETPCKVFSVTSPNPNEGKSITAANIAISFAMMEKKTLLIDADMRNPTQYRMWDISEDNGLSSLLARVCDSKLYTVKGLPYLNLVFAGRTPPNPSELLASANMSKLLEISREAFDYIIIDTPPINTVADAQILTRIVDGTVIVVRAGETNSRELLLAKDIIEQANGNICGVVLNDVDIKSGKYAYNYKYGYSYGYGKKYGYGEKYGYGNSSGKKEH